MSTIRLLQKNALNTKAAVALGVLLLFLPACERRLDRDLVNAAWHGDSEKIDFLLRKGANIEAHASDDWTPLTVAAREGHYGAVKLLLDKGAKVNAKEGGGHTPLFWAEQHDHQDVAELLRAAGGRNE